VATTKQCKCTFNLDLQVLVNEDHFCGRNQHGEAVMVDDEPAPHGASIAGPCPAAATSTS